MGLSGQAWGTAFRSTRHDAYVCLPSRIAQTSCAATSPIMARSRTWWVAGGERRDLARRYWHSCIQGSIIPPLHLALYPAYCFGVCTYAVAACMRPIAGCAFGAGSRKWTLQVPAIVRCCRVTRAPLQHRRCRNACATLGVGIARPACILAQGGETSRGTPSQVVMRDRVTQKPRGFGFVTFKEQEAAATACKMAHSIDGRTVRGDESTQAAWASRSPAWIRPLHLACAKRRIL